MTIESSNNPNNVIYHVFLSNGGSNKDRCLELIYPNCCVNENQQQGLVLLKHIKDLSLTPDSTKDMNK